MAGTTVDGCSEVNTPQLNGKIVAGVLLLYIQAIESLLNNDVIQCCWPIIALYVAFPTAPAGCAGCGWQDAASREFESSCIRSRQVVAVIRYCQ